MKDGKVRLVPVYTEEGKDCFMPLSRPCLLITDTIEGVFVNTAPLSTSKMIDLLAISQSDRLLKKDIVDFTDVVDPVVELKKIYIEVGRDLISFNVEDMPSRLFELDEELSRTRFTKTVALNFIATGLEITQATKQVDNSSLKSLAAIARHELKIKIAVTLKAMLNLETGALEVTSESVNVVYVIDGDGDVLELDFYGALVNQKARVAGYDLTAFRINSNAKENQDETEYLLSSPANADHLMESIAQLNAGQVQQRDLVDLQAVPVPDEKDRYLHKLAGEYHHRCEKYDRAVCTGPVVGSEIRPADDQQAELINKHALNVLNELKQKAFEEQDIEDWKVSKAINKYPL